MQVLRLIGAMALLCTGYVSANQASLPELINQYREFPHSCSEASAAELPPLNEQVLLQLGLTEELGQALAATGYPMSSARSISLSGPRDAQAAMQVLAQSFCEVLLDGQFVDVGVTQVGRDWRIVLARPLLSAKLEDWQSEGQRLLSLINQARTQARQCGEQQFAAAGELSWQPLLATTALAHSREMANANQFSHRGADGSIPSDRVELAGYSARQVGENLAAAQDQAQKVLESWLASPGHCANLMNPQFSQFGAAYAENPSSDAGIYWTALFAQPD